MWQFFKFLMSSCTGNPPINVYDRNPDIVELIDTMTSRIWYAISRVGAKISTYKHDNGQSMIEFMYTRTCNKTLDKRPPTDKRYRTRLSMHDTCMSVNHRPHNILIWQNVHVRNAWRCRRKLAHLQCFLQWQVVQRDDWHHTSLARTRLGLNNQV